MDNFKRDLKKVLEAIGAETVMKFPFRETESLRDTNIDVLNLGARSSNGLRRRGINNLGGVIDNWMEFSKWHGLGPSSIKEIKSSFYEYYYSTLSEEKLDAFWREFIIENCGTEV